MAVKLYDAIIFDVDGTLWNASAATAQGFNQGLATLDIKRRITTKQMQSVTGNPYERCVDLLLPGLLARYPGLLTTLSRFDREAVTVSGGIFYDGVIKGIPELAHQYKVFLVSNCQEWYLNNFLDFSGLASAFTSVDCYGLSDLSKADMLRRMKIKYQLEQPVYIGDTAGDEAAARLAEMAFIHAAYGFGQVQRKAVQFYSARALFEYLQALPKYHRNYTNSR